jgi:hypothetical protein
VLEAAPQRTSRSSAHSTVHKSKAVSKPSKQAKR